MTMSSTRDYYYELDDRGVLTLDGAVQDDPWFVDFFFRRLAPTANPDYPDHPFVSRCGDEMNYLRPKDSAIVYTGYDGERLTYAHSLSVLMHPDRLAYSPDGVLYHWALVGERGRIVPQVAMELSKRIEPWGPFFAYHDTERRRVTPLTPIEQERHLTFLRPRRDNQCVGCGEANPFSLQLSFVHDRRDDHIRTYVKPDMRMQGSLGITHGGFVSLLLDETMGKCLSMKGLRAPTARLNVSFHRPMKLDEEYEVSSWIERQEGRKNFLRATVKRYGIEGLVAEADALFITIR